MGVLTTLKTYGTLLDSRERDCCSLPSLQCLAEAETVPSLCVRTSAGEPDSWMWLRKKLVSHLDSRQGNHFLLATTFASLQSRSEKQSISYPDVVMPFFQPMKWNEDLCVLTFISELWNKSGRREAAPSGRKIVEGDGMLELQNHCLASMAFKGFGWQLSAGESLRIARKSSWCSPVIPVLESQRQEDLEVILG